MTGEPFTFMRPDDPTAPRLEVQEIEGGVRFVIDLQDPEFFKRAQETGWNLRAASVKGLAAELAGEVEMLRACCYAIDKVASGLPAGVPDPASWGAVPNLPPKLASIAREVEQFHADRDDVLFRIREKLPAAWQRQVENTDHYTGVAADALLAMIAPLVAKLAESAPGAVGFMLQDRAAPTVEELE